MKKSTISFIIDLGSAVIGGIGFLLFFFLLDIPFFFSALLGAGLYIGTALLLKPSGHKVGRIEISGLEDVEGTEKILLEGYTTMEEMKACVGSIQNQAVKSKAEKIFHTADQVFEYLEKNPKKIKAARRFFSYYLETTAKLLQKYEELEKSNMNVDSIELHNTLKKIEGVLDTIIAAFEKQFTRLLENEILDIESEISLLENTIKMEDF